MLQITNENIFDWQNKIENKISFSSLVDKTIIFGNVDGEIEINLEKSSEVNLLLVFLPIENSVEKKFKIIFNVSEYANLNLQVADMSNYCNEENFIVNLNGENAKFDFYSATIVHGEQKKVMNIAPTHLSKLTFSNIAAYEIIKDHGNGFIRCASDIRKGSGQSEAHQELRLLVLDETAKANSDPILLIDDNDIVASHANAIGMLDQDQMFYLLSRGLTERVAQELILCGYFNPIFESIADEQLKNYLFELLRKLI